MTGRRTLILTAPPSIFGGVATKARLLAAHLRTAGHRVTIAYYATLRADAELTVRLAGLATGRRPGVRCWREADGTGFAAVGCRLPELEYPYYRDSALWRSLIGRHDRHVAVGGTVLVALPLLAAGVAHLVWCASSLRGDRGVRHRAMGPARRLFDRLVVMPRLAEMERRVLAGPGGILAVSEQSADDIRSFAADSGRRVGRLPVPVDLRRFSPPPAPAPAGTVGFTGRLSDPRKNVGLLIDAVAKARWSGANLALRLAGEAPAELRRHAARAGIADRVAFAGRLADAALPGFYRGLDVFAIPSCQEGLNIAGVEAAACGVPVVTTRCGGPQGYVRDGVSGFLTGFDAAEMAARLGEIAADRELRARLSAGARRIAESEFDCGSFRRILDREWQAVWDESIDGD